jgi:hypothetical protein
MAIPEHLAILRQGVEAWNKWRWEHRDIIPHLSGADLSGAHLCEANLRGVDLSGADLQGAHLDGANLERADLNRSNLGAAQLRGAAMKRVDLESANLEGAVLERAHLSGADLRGACLKGVNLRRADLKGSDLERAELEHACLSGADLSGSNLCGANLERAQLNGSNLSKSMIGETVFVNVDLSSVNGLEDIDHKSPSSIGIDTLCKSKGNIPESFLRGCGVPELLIEYAKSLTNTPIQFYSCFISYNQQDAEFALRLHEDLLANDVRCWHAPFEMKRGNSVRPAIDESICVHDKLLLILSQHSALSDWVEQEAEHALNLEKERKKEMLFPVRLDEVVLDSQVAWAGNVRRERHIGDFSRWKDHDAYKVAFERLLQDLKAG